MEATYFFSKVDVPAFPNLSEEILDIAEGFVDRAAVLLLDPEKMPGPLKRLEDAHLVARG